jgi:integrase/recombinase XerD
MARKIRNVVWRNGQAYGRITRGGTEHWHALETSVASVAQERVGKWLAELKAQSWGEKRAYLFDAAVDLFTERHLPRVKPSTRKRYVHSLMNLADHLAGKDLGKIGSAELVSYETARRKAGVTTSTIRRDLATLSVLFEEAIDAEWIAVNPVKPYLKKAKRRGLVEAPPRTRYLSLEEELTLIHAAREMGKRRPHTRDMLADFIGLSVDLGLRSDELLGLSWRDVHIDRHEVYVQPSRAKSKVGRRVPILPRSLLLLRTMRRHPESLYVFWGEHGQRFREMWHAFQDAAAHAGIEDVTVHDLRRTCGCRLLQEHKLPLELVSKWLGHSSVKVTERHYAFLEVEHLHAAVGTGKISVRDRRFIAQVLDARAIIPNGVEDL